MHDHCYNTHWAHLKKQIEALSCVHKIRVKNIQYKKVKKFKFSKRYKSIWFHCNVQNVDGFGKMLPNVKPMKQPSLARTYFRHNLP